MIQISEHSEQATFFDTILYEYRLDETFLRPLLFSVPNGAYLGGRAPAMMAKLKREGLTPGVADIIYLQGRGEYNFLALEFKTVEKRNRKGGGLSEEQVKFLDSARSVGGWGVVCYGADDAIETFREYMDFDCDILARLNKNETLRP